MLRYIKSNNQYPVPAPSGLAGWPVGRLASVREEYIWLRNWDQAQAVSMAFLPAVCWGVTWLLVTVT